MRRTEREIKDRTEINAIIGKARVCRLGLTDGAAPYVVPMNFAHRDGVLYFHSAPTGKKIDCIKRTGVVCFEIDVEGELVVTDEPCGCTMRYESVIGIGRASIVDDPGEKRAALAAIAARYTGAGGEPPEESVRRVAVIRVVIDEVTGKANR
jgi:nitroimidazol reductase NimA-like FMN-containing flavoprotein (pyridoxamine 5'-phosphate oxidase superfamily)